MWDKTHDEKASQGWSAFVLGAAFWVPAYQGDSSSSGDGISHTTATLVATNGLDAAAFLALPLALTVAAGIGLHFRCSRGSVGEVVSAAPQ